MCIVFLHEISSETSSILQVGNKAYGLGRLLQAGFPIPPGFCITTEGYREFLAFNHLEGRIEALLSAKEFTNEEVSREVQSAILSGSLPSSLQAAIDQALQHLSDRMPSPVGFAVRSSAVAEDQPGASFAGQYDTYLQVPNAEAVIEKVKRCWASFWNPRSVSYRLQRHVGLADSGFAVLVQPTLAVEYAGVLFTIHPATGEQQMVIEMVPALGESLVSGQAAPIRCQLDRDTFQLLPPLPHIATLPQEQIERLGALALEIERFFGVPQDIEWAATPQGLYILQSRPITALPTAHREEPPATLESLLRRAAQSGQNIWTDDNVGEVVPGVVTPLTWSIVEPMGNQAFENFLSRMRLPHRQRGSLFGRFYGRVYFNQSLFQQIITHFYPTQAQTAKSQVERLRRAAFLLQLGLTAAWMIVTLPWEANRLARKVKLERQRYRRAAAPAEQSRGISNWLERDQQALNVHIPITVMALLLYSLLEKLTQRWGDGSVTASQLVTGLSGMKSAKMGRDLMNLAEQARTDERLQHMLTNHPPEEAAAWVSQLPHSHPFRQQLDRFWRDHGHASLQEFELAFPRWHEDPRYIFTLLANHLRANPATWSDDALSQRAARLNATRQMRQRLGFGARRLFFEMALAFAQRYSVCRENSKYAFVMAHSHLRRHYLDLAALLVQAQKLEATEAIFFLSNREVCMLATSHLENATDLVAQRRREYTHLQAEAAPKVLIQNPDGNLEAWEPPQVSQPVATRLEGVAASPGRVTGRARVILEPQDSIHLERGEILVAPSTNPAWSPLFLQAGGLVTDIGGLLSHGAIIAREYHLPAVLNIPQATRTIQTGQLLRVDGFTGTVELLDE